ncbi:hypothetical protein BDR07DRAFT_1502813 [Suillus spraguei]|nr:hypothetical protein BDR07DRAFT_1502813 [Suillus spraguei]
MSKAPPQVCNKLSITGDPGKALCPKRPPKSVEYHRRPRKGFMSKAPPKVCNKLGITDDPGKASYPKRPPSLLSRRPGKALCPKRPPSLQQVKYHRRPRKGFMSKAPPKSVEYHRRPRKGFMSKAPPKVCNKLGITDDPGKASYPKRPPSLSVSQRPRKGFISEAPPKSDDPGKALCPKRPPKSATSQVSQATQERLYVQSAPPSLLSRRPRKGFMSKAPPKSATSSITGDPGKASYPKRPPKSATSQVSQATQERLYSKAPPQVCKRPRKGFMSKAPPQVCNKSSITGDPGKALCPKRPPKSDDPGKALCPKRPPKSATSQVSQATQERLHIRSAPPSLQQVKYHRRPRKGFMSKAPPQVCNKSSITGDPGKASYPKRPPKSATSQVSQATQERLYVQSAPPSLQQVKYHRRPRKGFMSKAPPQVCNKSSITGDPGKASYPKRPPKSGMDQQVKYHRRPRKGFMSKAPPQVCNKSSITGDPGKASYPKRPPSLQQVKYHRRPRKGFISEAPPKSATSQVSQATRKGFMSKAPPQVCNKSSITGDPGKASYPKRPPSLTTQERLYVQSAPPSLQQVKYHRRPRKGFISEAPPQVCNKLSITDDPGKASYPKRPPKSGMVLSAPSSQDTTERTMAWEV